MKRISFFIALIFVLFTVVSPAFAQSKQQTTTIKVWGNCGMCKKTIEKTALANGASTATWNSESKMLDVQFASNKSSSEKIQQAIAAVGYDTEKYTASQEAYDQLHECCKYERKASAATATAATPAANHHDGCEMKDGKCTKDCCKDGKGMHGKKDGQSCKKDAACCKTEKCDMNKTACKDAAQCKEKGCCKS